MKKIINIVFYQFFGSSNSEKKSCIFYDDGTFENVSFEKGIDACEIIVKERNIQTKDAFREMINNDMVHVMSGVNFEKNFRNYFPRENKVNEEVITDETSKIVEEPVIDNDEEDKIAKEAAVVSAAAATNETGKEAAKVAKEDKEEILESKKEEQEEIVEDLNDLEADADDIKEEVKETKKEINNDEVSTEEKPKGFFKRAWEKFKNSKIAKRIVLCVTALAVGLGIYSIAKRQSKTGQMNNSNLANITTQSDINYQDTTKATATTATTTVDTSSKTTVAQANPNRDYEAAGTKFKALLDRTKNAFQKQAMMNADLALKKFNGEFADAYLEEGKDIRAALTFDEVVALQNAYNDYSKEELKAYFNGADINANKLTRAYKDATLQLMGAHIIENREHQVDMSMLIDSQEGKDFYNKYHNLFLECKEAKGDDKVAKVKQFYDMVRKDFYLSKELRTEGISHAEIHDIESYKLSVTPMIAASEMLFQNLRVDETLNDEEVEFFNSIGLCNVASGHFRRIETITLSGELDPENPRYEEYREALIEKYKSLGIYYIDDAHRELSKLDRFRLTLEEQSERRRIFGHGTLPEPGKPTKTTKTEEKKTTRTETETTTREETTRQEVTEEEVPEEIREELKERVDEELQAETEEAKRKAEEEAEQERQRQQQQADEEAKKVEEEVQHDEEQLQKDIEDANLDLEQGKPVSEQDFETQVDFDDEHSHDGVLDPSVRHITTDPTGDQTGKPLPDPEQTGEEFDRQAPQEQPAAPAQAPENPSTSTSGTDEGTVTSVEVPEGTVVDTFWVEEDPVDNASVVDQYINSLASQQETDINKTYQYKRA